MRVELLGIPRERAGVTDIELQADTLGQLLTVLIGRFPPLGDLMSARGFSPSVVANINGDRFVTDPQTPLRADDCVLILSADGGG
jgi:molybdopterin converting factor small subunit